MNDLENFCKAWEAKGVKPRISFIESPEFDTMADLTSDAEHWVLVFFKNGHFVCGADSQKGNTLDTVLPKN